MADKTLKFDLQIAAKQAQKDLKDTGKDASDLGTELDTVKGKGETLASAMKAMADQIDLELEQSQGAVDALGAALGDEFKGKIQEAGGSVDEMVGKLRNAGLSFDEIKADAEQLADAIRRVDESTTNLDNVKGGAQRLGTQLDQTNSYGRQTRSVMANMAGNTAQDLGQIAGVTGSLGVGIGQMAEYATEGGIAMKGLVLGGAGLAGIGLAMGALASRAREVAAADLWESERVKGYTEAIREGKDELTAVRDILRETEEIVGGVGELKVDIVPRMAELGISVETFAKLVAGTPEQLAAFEEGMLDAGAAGDSLDFVLGGVTAEQERYQKGVEAAELATKVFGTTVDTTREKNLRAKDAQRDHERAVGDLNAKYDDLYAATADQIAASDSHYEALGDLNAQYDTLDGNVVEVDTSLKDLDDTYSRLTGKFDDREAWLHLAASMDEFKGKMAAGELSTAEQEQAIIDLGREMAEYVTGLDNVPASKQTEILALIEHGKIAEAEAEIEQLTRPRSVKIGFATAVVPKFASGTPNAPGGLALVGEQGPELVELPSGSKVHTAAQTRSMVGSGGGGGSAGNTFIINALRLDERDVRRAIAKDNRRNGRG